MGTCNFGGMLASKTKQTTQQQQLNNNNSTTTAQQQQLNNNKKGEGREGADVNSLHRLTDCESLVIYVI